MVSPFPKGPVTLNRLQNLGHAKGLFMRIILGSLGQPGKGFIRPQHKNIGLYHYIPLGIFIYLLKPVRWGTLVPYTLLGECLIRSMSHMFGRNTRHFSYIQNYKQFFLKKLAFCLIILYVAKVFVHQFAH